MKAHRLAVIGALVVVTCAFTVAETSLTPKEYEFGPAEAKMALKHGPEWRTQLLHSMDTNRAEFIRLKDEWFSYMAQYPTVYTR